MIRPDVNRLRDRGADEHEGKHGACWRRLREPIGYHGKGEVEKLDRPRRLPGRAGRVCEQCIDSRGRGTYSSVPFLQRKLGVNELISWSLRHGRVALGLGLGLGGSASGDGARTRLERNEGWWYGLEKLDDATLGAEIRGAVGEGRLTRLSKNGLYRGEHAGVSCS